MEASKAVGKRGQERMMEDMRNLKVTGAKERRQREPGGGTTQVDENDRVGEERRNRSSRKRNTKNLSCYKRGTKYHLYKRQIHKHD